MDNQQSLLFREVCRTSQKMIRGKIRRRCQRAARNYGKKVPNPQSSARRANINLFFSSVFFFRLAHRSERTSPKRRDSPVVYLFNTSNHPYIWAVKGNLVQEQRSKTYNNPKKQAKNAKNKTKMKPRNKIHNTNKETNKLNRLRVLALMLPSPPITLNTSVSPHCNMKANQEITLTTL